MQATSSIKLSALYSVNATHGVVLFILVERVTSAIATSAWITSAYFRVYNIVHCYCSGITIYYISDCTCVYQVSLLVNWRGGSVFNSILI